MIKKLRKHKKLTQSQTAKKLEITQSYLSKLETNNFTSTHMSIKLLLKMSRVLNICPFILLGYCIKFYPQCHFKCKKCFENTLKM